MLRWLDWRLPTPEPAAKSPRLFIASIGFYLALLTGMHLYTFAGWATPLRNVDDTYTYIVKAVQMADGCFLQNCPALTSLRDQFATRESDFDLERQRVRKLSQTILVYHPLYSLLTWAAHATGMSWETAHELIVLGGVALIGLALAAFLAALWGQPAASVALLLLSVTFFYGQGLHLTVPSNLALGVGMLAWAALLHWREKASWLAVLLIAVMLGLHPIGRIWGAATLAFCFLVDRRPVSFGKILPYFAGGFLIAVAFLLPLIVDHPRLAIEAEPGSYIAGLLANMGRMLRILITWDQRGAIAGPIFGILMFSTAWWGYQFTPPLRRQQNLVILALFASIALAGLFIVLPQQPGELFSRLWIASAVILTGAVAEGLLELTKRWQSIEHRFEHRGKAIKIGIIAGVVLFFATGVWQVVRYAIQTKEPYIYSQAQVRYFSEHCGSGFYTDEVALLTYLSHGALACNTVYLPAMALGSAQRARIGRLPEPYFLVSSKPVERGLKLASGAKIVLTFHAPLTENAMWLRFAGDAHQAQIKLQAGQQTFTLAAAPDAEQWLKFQFGPVSAGATLSIEASDSTAAVYFTGLRFEPADSNDWPWNRDISLEYKRKIYHFDAARQSNGLFMSLDVVDAVGSSVLARVNRKDVVGPVESPK